MTLPTLPKPAERFPRVALLALFSLSSLEYNGRQVVISIAYSFHFPQSRIYAHARNIRSDRITRGVPPPGSLGTEDDTKSPGNAKTRLRGALQGLATGELLSDG